jgi:hypothetical protein
MTRSRPYTHIFESKHPNDVIEHIKWCRRNLGERGRDWDFAGSRKPTIFIYTEKYIPFYKLKFE